MSKYIRDVHGKVIAYKCSRCGKIVDSIWGDYCNQCWIEIKKEQEDKEYRENLLNLLKIQNWLLTLLINKTYRR